MRAAVVREFGAPLVIEERRSPEPGPGQVVVRREACEPCLTGWETLGLKQQNTGYSVDGGFAEYFIAEAAVAAPVPDGIDPVAAAPLTSAVNECIDEVLHGKARARIVLQP